MESHNQQEPLKTIIEGLYKRTLSDEVMEFLDDDPSNDEIGKGVLENNKLNDRLQSALKRDIRCTNECINAIDYVDKDKLSEEALKNLLNLKQQLVLIKEESIKEKYVGIEDITQDEFYILCGNKSLTEDEVKKIVKHALENKEDEMVVLMSLKGVTDNLVVYLQDVPRLDIPEDILTEDQKNILTNRVEN